MKHEQPPSIDFLDMPVEQFEQASQADMQQGHEQEPQASLYEESRDVVVTMYGKTDTIGNLSKLCPVPPSKRSAASMDIFTAKVLERSNLKVPERFAHLRSEHKKTDTNEHPKQKIGQKPEQKQALKAVPLPESTPRSVTHKEVQSLSPTLDSAELQLSVPAIATNTERLASLDDNDRPETGFGDIPAVILSEAESQAKKFQQAEEIYAKPVLELEPVQEAAVKPSQSEGQPIVLDLSASFGEIIELHLSASETQFEPPEAARYAPITAEPEPVHEVLEVPAPQTLALQQQLAELYFESEEAAAALHPETLFVFNAEDDNGSQDESQVEPVFSLSMEYDEIAEDPALFPTVNTLSHENHTLVNTLSDEPEADMTVDSPVEKVEAISAMPAAAEPLLRLAIEALDAPEAEALTEVVEMMTLVAERLQVLVGTERGDGEEAQQIEQVLTEYYEQICVAIGLPVTAEEQLKFIATIKANAFQTILQETFELPIDEGTHEYKRDFQSSAYKLPVMLKRTINLARLMVSLGTS